jgi:hypothetical protein
METRTRQNIFGLWAGEVVAGEIKTKASDFTEEQIERDAKLSSRLGADVHVLAAVEDVPSNIAAKAQRRCDEVYMKLVVLQKPDLHS